MTDPNLIPSGYELTPELLAELLKRRIPVALSPDEIDVLRQMLKVWTEKQERRAAFRSNWPIISSVVVTLTALLTFVLTQLPALFHGSQGGSR